jgi:ATP-binding protein involved in chromosome partitioning
MSSEADIRQQLRQISYPGSSRDIISLGLVGDIHLAGARVIVHLRTSSAKGEVVRHLAGRIKAALAGVAGVKEVEVHAPHAQHGGEGQQTSAAAPAAQAALPGVRRIIAVASGKGGVGKSTVAVNLTLALQALGNRVGLLDGDVYGPSMTLMMGTQARPQPGDNKKIHPVEKYGVRIISMGFFLDDKSPVIWRGPIVMSIIRQFLRDVVWGELDCLVVDLPPGTGDASLTLAQEVPLSGGVIVTTPQDVALLDVERSIAMFRQVNVPIIGVVENMSYYVCPQCGEREELFGHGGAGKTGLPMLGEVPLVEDLRVAGDTGRPLVVEQPDHPVSQAFRRIAVHVLESDNVLRGQKGARLS